MVERRPHVLGLDRHAGLDKAVGRAYVGVVSYLHQPVGIPEVVGQVTPWTAVLHRPGNDADATGHQRRSDRVAFETGHRPPIPRELDGAGPVDHLTGLEGKATHGLFPILVPGIGGLVNSLVTVSRSSTKYRRQPERQYHVSRRSPAGLALSYR